MLGGSSEVEHLVSIDKILGSFPNTDKTTYSWSSVLLFNPSSESFKTEAHWGMMQTLFRPPGRGDFFLKRCTLHSLGCPGTLYVEQASLKFTESCMPLPPELEACARR